jgi:lysophospholipase L1-like esterase
MMQERERRRASASTISGKRLVRSLPVTYGMGASTTAATYPSRLTEELVRHFPGHKITILNRGVSGEEVADMLARLDTAVIAEKPDLVLWQVGTNWVLRMHRKPRGLSTKR